MCLTSGRIGNILLSPHSLSNALAFQAEALLGTKAITDKELSAMQANAFKGLFKGGEVTAKLEIKTKNSVTTTVKYNFAAELSGGDSARPVKVNFPKEIKTK
jgi:hypothetical protein